MLSNDAQTCPRLCDAFHMHNVNEVMILYQVEANQEMILMCLAQFSHLLVRELTFIEQCKWFCAVKEWYGYVSGFFLVTPVELYNDQTFIGHLLRAKFPVRIMWYTSWIFLAITHLTSTESESESENVYSIYLQWGVSDYIHRQCSAYARYRRIRCNEIY